MISVSVFICTYNPIYDYLKRTVDAILKQSLSSEFWEFVIIDNNSLKPVSEIDFVRNSNVNVVVEKKQGLTAARGRATAIAKGNILVFVDDDNILAPNYLEEVITLFNANPQLGIVSGSIYPEYEIEPEKWFFKFENMIAIRKFSGDEAILIDGFKYSDFFPIGAGMAITNSLIYQYYNEHLVESNYIEGRKGEDLSSGEDIDLDYYAISKGYKIGTSPSLTSIHLIPAFRVELSYITKLTISALKSSYLVNKKWKPVFGDNVSPAFDIPLAKLIVGCILFKTISLVNKAFYVRYVLYRELFRYKIL